MPKLKSGGLLERIIKNQDKPGICESCENLVKVDGTPFGCAVHDKLVIPDYLPYHSNNKCPEWVKR